jgi:oligopeptide transport system ATP-binding protein
MYGNDPILSVQDVKKYFPLRGGFLNRKIGTLKAVDGVTFEVRKGDVLGIVGESGCGKSTLGKTLATIYKPTEGKIYFLGERIDGLRPKESKIIKSRIQYCYQNLASSLDPWWKVGRIVREPLLIHHRDLSTSMMQEKVTAILEEVGLEAHHDSRYTHEFSGGQIKRIGIARILILNPDVIIFDEPTAGLDVSVQGNLLESFDKLKNDLDLTYVFISHNLAVIHMVSNLVAVMYLGKIVEHGDTRSIFANPQHPYTRFLLAAVPTLDERRKSDIPPLTGEVPDIQNPPSGCRFHPRCPHASQLCTTDEPNLRQFEDGRKVACHLYTGSVVKP